MKRLTLLRHAKSSWADTDMRDFDRPLNKRGCQAAIKVGQYLEKNVLQPDHIHCSSAQRTRETAARVISAFSQRPSVELHEGLYLASPSAIIAHCKGTLESIDHLMVIGHNPGIQDATLTLTDATTATAQEIGSIAAKFPTAALACLDFDIDEWNCLRRQGGQLMGYVTPKDLKDPESPFDE